MKVVTTPVLKRLIENAARMHFNRQLAPAVAAQLDPDGKHVLSQSMLHNDVNIRCACCLLKMKDSDEPLEAILDFTFHDFYSLPEAIPVEVEKS